VLSFWDAFSLGVVVLRSWNEDCNKKNRDQAAASVSDSEESSEFRLVAAIHYNRQRVYVLRIFTHADYSKDA
jgi:mRNA-degrading endonuclease HigB of HigAB toxin-antitoxin module